MNLIKAFGVEVRRRRLEAGLSVEALADRARISAIQLGKVERGAMASGAGLGVVEKIAQGLGVPPGVLLGGVPGLSIVGYEAGAAFMWLREQDQRAVLKIIKALAPRRK